MSVVISIIGLKMIPGSSIVGNFNYNNVVCESTARSGHILEVHSCATISGKPLKG